VNELNNKKFNVFSITTIETINNVLELKAYKDLFTTSYNRSESKSIRLIGLRIRLEQEQNFKQLTLDGLL